MKKFEKPYLKRLDKISKFVVWEVDGDYIRTNMDEEFTSYGQHYRFRFIPKREFWIDKERVPGEERYYVDSMLSMNRLMARGIPHDQAVKISDKIERRERGESALMNAKKKAKKCSGRVLESIHKTLLKKYSSDKMRVWIVNGELVRDLFFIDFTEGGHDKVYGFIPPGEIWIDDDLEPREIRFVLLHEMHERNLMARGADYNSAHRSSSIIEYKCRQNPEMTGLKIKKEIKLSASD